MRITESRLRRIIRSVILEQAQIIEDDFNQLCQNYYKNPYGDPENPEPNNYNYYNKIKEIFRMGGNLTDALEERIEYYNITELENHENAESFCVELQKLLAVPYSDDLNGLLGFVEEISA